MKQLKLIFWGFLGALLFQVVKDLIPNAGANEEKVISASAFNLVDKQGKIRGQWGFAKEGPPGFWIMDEKGIARIVMGLYPDGTAHLGLQDKQGRMIQLARSFGPDEAPLLIFKHQGMDSMILGLNPGDKKPFLMHYEKDRKRKLEFGNYEGP
jgi:hypothetical protein